jgi:outer membrane protein OmpA-like peptidoglycan-associated protein
VAFASIPIGIELASPVALAQHAAVTVDLGALDALGPEKPAANPGSGLRLHLPERTPPAAGRKAQPVHANTSRPSPAKPQANATLPAPSLPSPTVPPPSPPISSAPPPVPAQAASAPPAAQTSPPAAPKETAERILFQPDEADLAGDAKQELDQLAARLTGDGRLYAQLVAYAGGSGDASQARRLSLTRALAARSYLVDHGVEIKQIDVRPLGNRSEPGAPADRIDIVVTQR